MKIIPKSLKERLLATSKINTAIRNIKKFSKTEESNDLTKKILAKLRKKYWFGGKTVT